MLHKKTTAVVARYLCSTVPFPQGEDCSRSDLHCLTRSMKGRVPTKIERGRRGSRTDVTANASRCIKFVLKER